MDQETIDKIIVQVTNEVLRQIREELKTSEVDLVEVESEINEVLDEFTETYVCEKCDYTTTIEKYFKRHLKTDKHNRVEINKEEIFKEIFEKKYLVTGDKKDIIKTIEVNKFISSQNNQLTSVSIKKFISNYSETIGNYKSCGNSYYFGFKTNE